MDPDLTYIDLPFGSSTTLSAGVQFGVGAAPTVKWSAVDLNNMLSGAPATNVTLQVSADTLSCVVTAVASGSCVIIASVTSDTILETPLTIPPKVAINVSVPPLPTINLSIQSPGGVSSDVSGNASVGLIPSANPTNPQLAPPAQVTITATLVPNPADPLLGMSFLPFNPTWSMASILNNGPTVATQTSSSGFFSTCVATAKNAGTVTISCSFTIAGQTIQASGTVTITVTGPVVTLTRIVNTPPPPPLPMP